MIEIRRILCPIDFSDHSRRALDHAIAIARWYRVDGHGSSRVLASSGRSVSEPGEPMIPSIATSCSPTPWHLPRQRAHPASPLRRWSAKATRPAKSWNRRPVMKADLLVIGTHGRSGFERLLLGSVAEKVLRKVSCPVLTVPRRLPDAVPAGPVLYKESCARWTSQTLR